MQKWTVQFHPKNLRQLDDHNCGPLMCFHGWKYAQTPDPVEMVSRTYEPSEAALLGTLDTMRFEVVEEYVLLRNLYETDIRFYVSLPDFYTIDEEHDGEMWSPTRKKKPSPQPIVVDEVSTPQPRRSLPRLAAL